MTDADKETKEALPDLSLWDGLQDALKIRREPRKKRPRRQPPEAKNQPQPEAGTSAIKACGQDEANEFRCESCGKSWARYGFFIKHVKKRHDISELIANERGVGGGGGDAGAKIRCRFCHGLVAERHFFDHFWRRHVDHGLPLDAQKPCLLCKKSLGGLDKLRLHLKVIHFKELHIQPSEYASEVTKALL